MGKLIEIDNCYRCAYRGTLDCRSHFCRKSGRREITTNIFTEIPDWCPLPDASQLHKRIMADEEVIKARIRELEAENEKLREEGHLTEAEIIEILDGNAAFLDKRHAEIDAIEHRADRLAVVADALASEREELKARAERAEAKLRDLAGAVIHKDKIEDDCNETVVKWMSGEASEEQANAAHDAYNEAYDAYQDALKVVELFEQLMEEKYLALKNSNHQAALKAALEAN